MDPFDKDAFLKLEEGPFNVWREDGNLRRQMQMRLSDGEWAWGQAVLDRYGELCGGPVYERARVVDEENHKLRRYDQWGQDVSEFLAHPAYLQNVADLYGGGIVGWNHQQENLDAGRRASFHQQFGWGVMTGGADIGVYCPICMTHGASWLIERFAVPALQERFVPRLNSTDPQTLHTGAMLLTEITGGSDVGASRTVAKPAPATPGLDGVSTWSITGEKWFSSNAGADVFMVLARPEGAPKGPKGLGLFLLPRVKADGTRNHFQIRRIKDKVGTRNVATAEILFHDAEGYQVGEVDRGIYYMMDMVNLSRLYNAVASVGTMARTYLEAKRYAHHREAFGKTITDYPAVKETLTDMAVKTDAALALTFEAVDAYARAEDGDGDAWALCRLLTPLCKYHTGEEACHNAREAACLFAGNGTIKDFGIERLYRDALILPIWEGTANIQHLDVLRAVQKEDALTKLQALMDAKLATVTAPAAAPLVQALRDGQQELQRLLTHWLGLPQDELLLHARRCIDRLIAWSQGVCLAAEGQWEQDTLGDGRKFLVAARHVARLSGEDPVLSADRFALDHFGAVVNFDPVSGDELAKALPGVLVAPVRV